MLYAIENPDTTSGGKKVWRRAKIVELLNDEAAFNEFTKGPYATIYPYVQKRLRNITTHKIIARYGYGINLSGLYRNYNRYDNNYLLSLWKRE